MEKYSLTSSIGFGTYGNVIRGLNQQTGQIVAVKKMKQKFYSWQECLQLKQISILRTLKHPNIVKLKQVIRNNDQLNLIFEYCDSNLIQVIKQQGSGLNEFSVRQIIEQTLIGLNQIHSKGFFHRDIKPQNILKQQNTFKIADFGLAKEIRKQPPFTDYVSTRWYRAPQLLLHSRRYSYQVDIFALGCIMAELYLGRPIFGGANQIDQLNRLCSVLGTPDWPEGHRLASAINYCFPQYVPTSLETLIPNASAPAVQLIRVMLTWDPLQRPSAEQCLQQRFFQGRNERINFGQERPRIFNPQIQPRARREEVNGQRETIPILGQKFIPRGGIGQGRHRFQDENNRDLLFQIAFIIYLYKKVNIIFTKLYKDIINKEI